MTAEDFAGRIRGAAPSQTGQWSGHCPAHDDRAESLSWNDGRHGLVVTCHAGCSVDQIARSLGLTVSQLFSENGHDPRPRKATGKLVAVYPYHRADGSIAFEVCRFEPKDFRQRRPDGRGGHVWSIAEAERVVYRLPQLAGATRAWWCEGEKDADRLAALGLPSTTSPGGANAYRPDYSRQLHDAGCRELIILPDNDPAGLAYAQTVAAASTTAGLRCRILPLPGLATKGADVSDWLNAGGTLADLTRLADKAPVWDAPKRGALPPGLTIDLVADSYYVSLGEGVAEFSSLDEHRGDIACMVTATNTSTGKTFWGKVNLSAPRSRADLAKTLAERCAGMVDWRVVLDDGAAEVARRYMAGEPAVEMQGPPPASSTAWWVPGLFPMDVVSLLFGKGGSGKSITAVALALASLRPAPLGGSRGWQVRPMRSILYLDWEADAGAVHRRLYGLAAAEHIEIPPGFRYLRMTRPLHQSIPMVAKEIRAHAVEAIIVDSWVPATGTNARNDADGTSQIMAAIRTLGRTCLGIAHVTNSAAEGESESRPFGSVFNQNLARSLVEVTSESDDNALRVTYRHTKINDGRHALSRGLVFTYSDDGQIAVESGEPDLEQLSIPQQILIVLREGRKSASSLAESLDVSENKIRTALGRLENKGRVMRFDALSAGRGHKGEWGLRDTKRITFEE